MKKELLNKKEATLDESENSQSLSMEKDAKIKIVRHRVNTKIFFLSHSENVLEDQLCLGKANSF